MNEQLSLKEAKRLSIIKWEILADESKTAASKGYDIRHHPELRNLTQYCGFCERHVAYIDDDGDTDVNCTDCELAVVMGGSCNQLSSLYSIWNTKEDRSSEAAQRLLDVIKSISIEE